MVRVQSLLNLTGAAVALMATGCALTVPPEEDPVYIELQQVEARVDRVEKVVSNNSLMELAASVERLEQENRELRNQVETLDFKLDENAKRQREQYLDLDTRMQGVETAGVAAVGAVSVMDGGTLRAGELPVPGGTDRANYQASFELLKQGRYDDAGKAFGQFLVAFPESSLADNAQYWYAETHYVQQRYQQALPEFEKVVKIYPQSRKIPDALLKIGYCNYELQRWDSARGALTRVAGEYPETTAARLANQRLERMQGEGR